MITSLHYYMTNDYMTPSYLVIPRLVRRCCINSVLLSPLFLPA